MISHFITLIDRVVPAHSYKFISELQYQLGEEEYQQAPLLIRIETKVFKLNIYFYFIFIIIIIIFIFISIIIIIIIIIIIYFK